MRWASSIFKWMAVTLGGTGSCVVSNFILSSGCSLKYVSIFLVTALVTCWHNDKSHVDISMLNLNVLLKAFCNTATIPIGSLLCSLPRSNGEYFGCSSFTFQYPALYCVTQSPILILSMLLYFCFIFSTQASVICNHLHFPLLSSLQALICSYLFRSITNIYHKDKTSERSVVFFSGMLKSSFCGRLFGRSPSGRAFVHLKIPYLPSIPESPPDKARCFSPRTTRSAVPLCCPAYIP